MLKLGDNISVKLDLNKAVRSYLTDIPVLDANMAPVDKHHN